MGFQHMQAMPQWKLSVYALGFFLDTLCRAVWRRKGDGIIGCCRYPILLALTFAEMCLALLILRGRARLMFWSYAWFRRVDDVMDDDAPPPRGYAKHGYLAHKAAVMKYFPSLNNGFVSLSTEEILLLELQRVAARYGEDIIRDVASLWSVMLWEYERRGSSALPSRTELVSYAVRQDRAIFDVFIIAFRGDVARFRQISAYLYGVFTRTDWLVDMEADLKRGIVNIPEEAAATHGLDLKRLLACGSWNEMCKVRGFAPWYKEEALLLERQWREAEWLLGKQFGEAFTSPVVAFLFRKLAVERNRRKVRLAVQRALL